MLNFNIYCNISFIVLIISDFSNVCRRKLVWWKSKSESSCTYMKVPRMCWPKSVKKWWLKNTWRSSTLNFSICWMMTKMKVKNCLIHNYLNKPTMNPLLSIYQYRYKSLTVFNLLHRISLILCIMFIYFSRLL